jgi:ABC transporter DrrB family efflux protein
MPNHPLWEMTKGRIREFRREPSAFYFVIFMPILWMIILGISLSGDKKIHHHIGALNRPDVLSKLADKLASEQLSIEIGTEENLRMALQRGRIDLWISEEGEKVTYHFDPKNPNAQSTRLFVDALIQQAFGQQPAILTLDEPMEQKGSRYIDFLIPGLLAFSLLTTSLYGTGMTLVVNRRDNLLKRLRVTPMRISDFFASHLIGRILIMCVELASITLAGKILFGFPMEGNFLAYIALCILGALTFTSMSFFLGARLSNSSTYNGMSNLVIVPMMLLSGIWYSRNHFPDWLIHVTDFLPLTALVDALRRVALEGVSISDLGFQLTILLGYLGFSLIGAMRTFKWQP